MHTLYRALPPQLKEVLRPVAQGVLRQVGYDWQRRRGPAAPAVIGSGSGSERDFWGNRHLDDSYWNGLIHWGQIPIVAERINERISGNKAVDFIEYSRSKYVAPLRSKRGKVRMLSLCCGIGELELRLLKSNYCDEVIGYDVSASCIERANQLAAEQGLSSSARFFAADLNALDFNHGESFDVILNEAALHHISNLEHLLERCRSVCHPDSLFVNHDYIGPNHHQWTPRQINLINDVLAILPNELKSSRTNPGAIHFTRKAHTLSEMMRIDPTEGVRSKDTIPVMAKWFATVERKDFGGALMHLLFNDIAGNFLTPQSEPLVRMIVLLEDKLMESEYLPSDFSFWIAKPRI